MARDDTQLKVRMTEEMKAKLSKAAEINGRSLNAEILNRLERTILEEETYDNIYEYTGELGRQLEALQDKVAVLWAIHEGRDPYNWEK